MFQSAEFWVAFIVMFTMTTILLLTFKNPFKHMFNKREIEKLEGEIKELKDTIETLKEKFKVFQEKMGYYSSRTLKAWSGGGHVEKSGIKGRITDLEKYLGIEHVKPNTSPKESKYKKTKKVKKLTK